MTTAVLGDPNDNFTLKEHIVTGTVAGYVYAVLPGDTVDATTTKQSTLSYASDDLGWYATGLDAGDLDGDGEDEVVVGVLVDASGFDQWYAGDASKNRGGVLILRATQNEWDTGIPTCKLEGPRITGDTTFGVGYGIGAGVFGIKIDDVNGQGPPEIWATDALGHLYLLRDSGNGQYGVWYRSDHVGAHPGVQNNLHPLKDANGKTYRLAVVSSGYLMVFDVDSSVVPQ